MIETARLCLTSPTVDDWPEVCAMWADPGVTRHIGGEPAPTDVAWMRLLRSIGHWSAYGWGLFAIRDRATGTWIGETGLARFERGLGEDFDGDPEAAWVLASAAHGHGLAAEAAAAAHDWFDRTHGARRSVCLIAAANTRSIALADRLGYRVFREATYKDVPSLLLQRVP